MKYQLIRVKDNHILTEAARRNDGFLIQEIRKCFDYCCFKEGLIELRMDGLIIDPDFILQKDDERYDRWLEKKQQTHRRIGVSTGVACLPQNLRKVWVRK